MTTVRYLRKNQSSVNVREILAHNRYTYDGEHKFVLDKDEGLGSESTRFGLITDLTPNRFSHFLL